MVCFEDLEELFSVKFELEGLVDMGEWLVFMFRVGCYTGLWADLEIGWPRGIGFT